MFKNYLKIAFRVFKKEKLYSLINISGLSLGLMCCLIIVLFVKDELSYDSFHKEGDSIYRLSSAYLRAGKWEPYATNAWKTAELLEANFPEIEQLVKIGPNAEIVTYEDKRILEKEMAFVDANFFDVFSFTLISGNQDDVLKEPNKVVISESIANKYFGEEDPIGKILEMTDGEYKLQVSGVMKDMPSNSHFHFDFLISGQTSKQVNPEAMFSGVTWDSQWVYLKISNDSNPESIMSQFPDFINTHMSKTSMLTSENFQLALQPLSDIHLESDIGNELEANGSMNHIYIFSIIAIFILVIACINYMNLTTARSIRRAAEVGMRKVLGAKKLGLIGQFLTESFIMTFGAILLAFGLTFLLLPYFNTLAEKEMVLTTLFSPKWLGIILASSIIIGFLSGSYPAFVLSSFKPLNALKGNNRTGTSGIKLRKILVVFQFGISIGLIAATSIVFEQIDFLKNKELGFDEELLISIPLQSMDRNQVESFKNQLLANNDIIKAGGSNMRMPGWISESTYYKAQDVQVDEDAPKSMKLIGIDHDFIKTTEVDIISGHDFSKVNASNNRSVVLNESAIEQLGWENPVGKWLEFYGRRYIVVGVVKDFHFESLFRKIPPTIFSLTEQPNFIYAKVDGNKISESLKYMSAAYSKFVTNRDFSYSFVNEEIQSQYKSEEQFAKVFTIFTILAIFIACLGAFGLISFTIERKSKELSIRKVLGASIGNLSSLLIKEFVILLFIASLVAWPVTFYFIHKWIEGFIYRISVEPAVFLIATTIAMIIAIITIGFKVFKAALVNPIISLRKE
jgi:putative ABC transport system permease protein